MTTPAELAALDAELHEALAEMQQAADALRAESAALLAGIEVERAQLRTAREQAQEEYAEQARDGGAGRARQELQRRIDAEETTWREVLSGEDPHWSAVEVRTEIAGDARAEVDLIEQSDPDLARTYRTHATLREGGRIGEWHR